MTSDQGTERVVLNLSESEARILRLELRAVQDGAGWSGDEVDPEDILEKLERQL